VFQEREFPGQNKLPPRWQTFASTGDQDQAAPRTQAASHIGTICTAQQVMLANQHWRHVGGSGM
jgi:hypothetical protein